MTARIPVLDNEPDLEVLVQKFRHWIRDQSIELGFVRDGIEVLTAL
jgi:hypothetical protein